MKLAILICLTIFGITLPVWSADYKPEYRMSIVVGPAGPWGEGAARFAETVKKVTDGRVNIKPYYNGRLFDGRQTDEFSLMEKGAIDFALGSTINWSTTVKEFDLFSLPFFFHSYKVLDAVEAGEAGKQLFDIMSKKGVIGLGWGENGFRDLTNDKRPVSKPEDLNGLRIRVVGSPIFIDTFRAMGADPVPINWGEALAAFRKGTVDGQENPIVSVIIPNKIWQVHKYITIWNYAVDPLVFAVSKLAWDTFTTEDKAAIRKAAVEVAAWQKKAARKGLENSDTAVGMLKRQGMEVTILTPVQMKAFRNRTKPVYDKWVKQIGPALVNTAERAIAEAGKQ